MGAFLNLMGQKFGKWMVIKRRKNDSRGKPIWACKCECGKIKNVSASSLRGGFSKSCGKYLCESIFLDLSNKKFWKLTAIRPTNERQQGHMVWMCRCDCGNVVKKSVPLLKRGQYPNCGDRKCSPYFEDLTGKIFGKLTVIDFSDMRSTKRTSRWNCQCNCGNVVKTDFGSLVSGRTKSCGCIRKDGQYESIVKRSYRSHVFSAKYRNIVNFLSKEEYFAIGSNPCYYCGNFDIKTNNSTGATIKLNGVDRKNNEKFYKIENSLSCCGECNVMKQDSTYKQFMEKIQKIINYQNNKIEVFCPNLDQAANKESALQNLCSENIPP
jgi:hypothetical protein